MSSPTGLELLLLRHGETEWSLSGQHTGTTDLPLLPRGRAQAEALRPQLSDLAPALVLSSPLRRARDTAELAGLQNVQVDANLREWNYGVDEGLTTQEILAKRPNWKFWDEGCPGGETPADVGRRCDQVLAHVRGEAGNGLTVLVAHGHLLRVLIARWLALPPSAGQYWVLRPASLSRLGHEHDRPVVLGLNRSVP